MTYKIIALYGLAVGLLAISTAIWSLVVHRNHWDATHVASLYILGTILVIIFTRITSFEDPVHAGANGIVITTVLYWIVVIIGQLYMNDPVVEEFKDS